MMGLENGRQALKTETRTTILQPFADADCRSQVTTTILNRKQHFNYCMCDVVYMAY